MKAQYGENPLMHIYVSQRHRAQGKKKDCVKCPLALAMAEELNGVWYVGGSTVSNDHTRFVLPDEAQAFVKAFDEGLIVEPQGFHITQPYAA